MRKRFCKAHKSLMSHVMRRPRLTASMRRESLLDAARAIAAEKSLSGITMEGVAQMAGVNKALVYRHLPDADAVRAALLERESRRLAEAIAEKLNDAKGLELRLAAIFDVWVAAIERADGLLPALLQQRSGAVHEKKRSGRNALETLLTAEIQRGSTLKPETAIFAANLLISSANGVTQYLSGSPSRAGGVKAKFLAAAMGMIRALENL